MTSKLPDQTSDLQHRLRFEAMLADLSSKFINLAPADVDREIEDALRRVCELLDVDYAVLWQWSPDDAGVIRPTHAYPAPEGVQPSSAGHEDQFPWCVQEMLAGRMIAIASLEELPEEAAVDRESALLSGIKSNLCLPLSLGGGPPVGALALNTLRVERDWPDVLVKQLQLVAHVIANALARRRHELRLQESEARLALAADSAGAGLWTLDLSTSVFWATERARSLFGYSPDEVIDMERFKMSVHPDDWDLVREAVERAAGAGEPIDVEYRIVNPENDDVRWLASRGRPRPSSLGESVSLMGVSTDITERKRAEDALRASEARLAAGSDLAGLAFYEVDLSGRAYYVDDRFRDFVGLPPERETGLGPLEFYLELLHPDDREYFLEERRQLHDGTVDRAMIEYRIIHPTRGETWVHHAAGVAQRDPGGRAVRTFGVLRDITERKRADHELRDLSRRLISAHEEERALLARELHDDLTQRVAVLAIDVGRTELAAADGSLAESMRSLREELVRLSEDIHSLAYQLHPSVLEDLGLAEALRAECERQDRRGSLELSLELDPVPAAIGKDAALCLFRVAQEALNNVGRHASASAAGVTLRQVDDGLYLAVRDDGIGFDPASPGVTRSLGLASMRERVRLVSGELDIESAPGQGTTIVAWVPADGGSG